MNMLAPPKGHYGHASWKLYEKYMCDHFDIVILESGVHDFSVPDRHAATRLAGLCGGKRACTDAEILPVLLNQTWRLNPLESYRKHLTIVMERWALCKKIKKSFRPIFKLAFAPSPQKCQTDWGYNTDAFHVPSCAQNRTGAWPRELALVTAARPCAVTRLRRVELQARGLDSAHACSRSAVCRWAS